MMLGIHAVDGSILKAGYLFKKGDFRQKWRPRYFILRSNPRVLEYFNSPTESIRGTIAIDERTKVSMGGGPPSSSSSRKSAPGNVRPTFTVKTHSSRILVLAHDDFGQVEEWILAINTLIQQSKEEALNSQENRRGSMSHYNVSQDAATLAQMFNHEEMKTESSSAKRPVDYGRAMTQPIISKSAPASRVVSPDPPSAGSRSATGDEGKYADDEPAENTVEESEPLDIFYEKKIWPKVGMVPYNELRKIRNEIIDQSLCGSATAQWRLVEVQNSMRLMGHTSNPKRFRLGCTFRKMSPETLFLALRKGMVSSKLRPNWDSNFVDGEVLDKYGMHTDLVKFKVKFDLFGPYMRDWQWVPTLDREVVLMRHWFALDEVESSYFGESQRIFAIVFKSIPFVHTPNSEVASVTGGYVIYSKDNACHLVQIMESDFINVSNMKHFWYKTLLTSVPVLTGFIQSRLNYLLTSQLCAFRDFIEEHEMEELETLFSDSDSVHLGELLVKGRLSPKYEEKDSEMFSISAPSPDSSSVSKPGLEDNMKYPAGVPDFERSPEGGMVYLDEEQVSNQRWVAQDLIKSMGSNVMQGKSLISISMPVKIFEPRSFLQRMPDMWTFGPIYLRKAAECTDPVERLKYVIVFIVAGLHRGLTQKKPFNPILGETFECSYADGTEVALEQTAHHPPISAFEMRAPDGAYVYTGQHEYKASLGINHATGLQEGSNNVQFQDGGLIQFNMPTIMIKGILWGARHIYWTKSMTFTDQQNSLHCELQFSPAKKSGWFGSSGGGSGAKELLLDSVVGEMYCGKDKTLLCQVEGSWLGSLSFGGKTYWRFNEEPAYKVLPKEISKSLPSDARNRMDLLELEKGDLDSAGHWKHVLEELQRKDRKLRKELGPPSKKH